MIPSVIDNQKQKIADVLEAKIRGKAVDDKTDAHEDDTWPAHRLGLPGMAGMSRYKTRKNELLNGPERENDIYVKMPAKSIRFGRAKVIGHIKAVPKPILPAREVSTDKQSS